MTDDTTRQVPPEPAPPPATPPAAAPTSAPDDDMGPAYAAADRPAPTANVMSGQVPVSAGAVAAGAAARRRETGVRWAIALGGVAVVIAATAVILVLASGRPTPSVAVGYMPADAVSYSEYRFDLPGDQRTKLAAFLSKFPGFEDQSSLQVKLYDVFDRIVRAASKDSQSYTADIDPWFAGQIAVGTTAINQNAAGTGAATLGGSPLVVVTVKDEAKAKAWLTKTAGDSLSETQYNGATLYKITRSEGASDSGGVDGDFSIVVTDKIMLGGTDASVRAAFDSKGEGKLAEDAEFQAAFGTVSRDFVGFGYSEVRGIIQSMLAAAGPGSSLDSTTVDDELLTLVPTWTSNTIRFENDSLVSESAFPSIDIGFEAKNKKSTLIGHAPSGTLVYAETHDVGPALNAILERLRKLPELRDAFAQVDSTIGMVGGFDGLFGWWGDAAVVVAKDADGSVGGGLLIQPTNVDNAKAEFERLRSLIAFAGANSGVELRDVDHNGTKITVIDLSALAQSGGGLPPGVKAEIAYAVTDDVVVVGYGEAFVASVLDAGPGKSLADSDRFGDLVKRAGEENIGLTFVDVTSIRDLVEPLAKKAAPADKWAYYEKEIKPYLLPLDVLVSGSRIDGDLNRLTQALIVK